MVTGCPDSPTNLVGVPTRSVGTPEASDGGWKMYSRIVRTSASRQHAMTVISRAKVGSSGQTKGSQPLAALAIVGNHVNTCTKCRKVWIDGGRPVDYLNAWARTNGQTRPFWVAADLETRPVRPARPAKRRAA